MWSNAWDRRQISRRGKRRKKETKRRSQGPKSQKTKEGRLLKFMPFPSLPDVGKFVERREICWTFVSNEEQKKKNRSAASDLIFA
jgi:hypothetical protein